MGDMTDFVKAKDAQAKVDAAVEQARAPFDWKKTLWRGVRAGAAALGAIMLDAAVRAGSDALSDPEQVTAIFGGGPRAKAAAAAVVMLGVGAAIKNWWKNRHRTVANTTA